MISNNRWKPNTAHLDKMTEPEAKFIFEQAEKKLKEISDNIDLVVGRTTTLLMLIIGFIIGLMGYSINKWDSNNSIDSILITCIVIILYLILIAVYLSSNIKSREYKTLGTEPKLLMNDSLFALDNEKRTKAFYISEIADYQSRIDTNTGICIKRWIIYNSGLKYFLFSPALLLLTQLLVEISSGIFCFNIS